MLPILTEQMVKSAISDEIVGRELILEEFLNFEDKFNYLGTKTPQVRMYYGVGGVGKTTLLHQFLKRLNSHSHSCTIDLAHLPIKEKQEILLQIRMKLGSDYGISFPNFDFSYIYYVHKTSGNRKEVSTQLTEAKKESILKEITSKLAKSGQKVLVNSFDPIGLTNPIIDTSIKVFKDRFLEEGQLGDIIYRVLNKVSKEKKEKLENSTQDEILDSLTEEMSMDIKNYTIAKKKKIYIFIDTYEAIEEQVDKAMAIELDNWLRNFVKQSTNIHWFIFGRKALRWESDLNENKSVEIKQEHLEEISYSNYERYMKAEGIYDSNIIDAIYEVSKGLPFAFKLSIYLYYEMGKPPVEQFLQERTKTELYHRFKKYLKRHEHNLLEQLSLCGSWDIDLLSAIEERFHYHPEDFDSLLEHSFIKSIDKNLWTMHDLMKEAMKHRMHERVRERGNRFLFDYFSKKMGQAVSSKQFDNGLEFYSIAFDYGYQLLKDRVINLIAFNEWFNSASNQFVNNEQLKDIIIRKHIQFLNYIDDEKKLKSECEDEIHQVHSKVLYDLAYIYIDLEKYEEAELKINRTIELTEKYFNENDSFIAKPYYGYGRLLQKKLNGDKEKAIQSYKKAIAIYKQNQNIVGEMYVVNALGHLYMQMNKLNKAEIELKRSVKVRESTNKFKVKDKVISYLNLVDLYMRKGDYTLGKDQLKKAEELLVNDGDENSIYIMRIQNHLGTICIREGEFQQAKKLFKSLLERFSAEMDNYMKDYMKTLHNEAVICYLYDNKKLGIKKMLNLKNYKKEYYGYQDHRYLKSEHVYEQMEKDCINAKEVYLEY